MTQQLDITDVVPTEKIEKLILGVHVSTPVALQFAWGETVGRGTGNNMQIPRLNNVTTNPGTKAESAQFALVSTTTASENLVGGWVGHSDEVSWESNTHGVESSLGLVIDAGVAAITDRIDTDGLAIIAGATNSTSFTLAALTDNGVITAKAAYLAQRPHKGRVFFAIYTTQMRDWATDLNTNGGNQLGGNAESERVAKLLDLNDGFVGVRHGLAIFTSENVATAAGDATGAMGKLGRGGPLAYRSWSPIGWEAEWQPRSKLWEVTLAANYGYTVSDQANLHAVISRST